MQKLLINAFGLLFMCFFVVACVPLQAVPAAPATAIPTSIPVARPTETPLPAPEPTETAPATSIATLDSTQEPAATAPAPPEGWREYATERFSLSLPERWETADVSLEGAEAVLDVLDSLDSDWARNLSSAIDAETLKDVLVFWAMDSEPAGVGYANANLTYEEQPFVLTGEAICQQMSALYEQIGIEVLDTGCDLQINGTDVVQLTTRLGADPGALIQRQYIYFKDRDLWVLTLTVDEAAWEDYQPVFESIGESFRLNS